MDDSANEIRRLRATIEVLEQENSQLSERAEDAMLLGLVAEAIQGLNTPREVFECMLERISILKNIPFVTCGTVINGRVEPICSYSSFSDDDLTGYPIFLQDEILDDLSDTPMVYHSPEGISTTLAEAGFSTSTVTLIPFRCHDYGNGLCLFFAKEEPRNTAGSRLFLLDQIVNMTVGFLNNLFLTRELDRLNSSLEDRILEKTAALQTANEQLHEAHTRFTTVLDGIDSCIYVVDMENYEILYLNKKSKDLIPAGAEGKLCYKYLKKENFPCLYCKIPEMLTSSVSASQGVVWEFYDDDSQRWTLHREKIVSWPSVGLAKLTIATDITAIKKAEEEREKMQKSLQQAQKMEAVGVLAGSVAHDLNNILSGIVSYPDLLLADKSLKEELRKPLLTIQAAGKKAAAIVTDLLTLARRGLKIDETVDLGRIVREYRESAECNALLKRHAKVKIVAPDPPGSFTVMGSSAHLSNVLMNIVTNAVEAMPEGGTITIALKVQTLTTRPEGWSSWRAGDYVRLSVTDTGIGIPDELQKKIFDPFFSGKKLSHSGTGLGLAIVWGTVIDHHGAVSVESEEGKGTTFHIHLPVKDTHTATIPAPKPKEPILGTRQSVLIVDDVENQRQIASDILKHLNYSSTSVKSGEAALQFLRKNRVDLVMLDMIMPGGMDGLETYKNILTFRPDQKVIIVSGYSQTERILEARQLGIEQYVSKPYTLLNLSEAIHRALSS